MNPQRIRQLNSTQQNFKNENGNPVIYWMSRDQRVHDNWSLIFAQELAIQTKSPLLVVFGLTDKFLNASSDHYYFMLENLKSIEINLQKFDIPFLLLPVDSENFLSVFINKSDVQALVTDFDPLKVKIQWKEYLLKQINIPFFEVDSHNIIPCRLTSDKQEYAAYTIRPKIKKLLPDFLDDFTKTKKHPFKFVGKDILQDWDLTYRYFGLKNKMSISSTFISGEKNALSILKKFIKDKIELYPECKNDPNSDCLSNLSPYLHFGQISAQRVAQEIIKSDINQKAKDAFLEELIIRRELSDNFCYYNKNYDNFNGFPKWSQNSLKKHIKDKREYIYSRDQFENSDTHDELWNAAQSEMVKTGKMHGYMRMYWAKKILEWSKTPDEAIESAIYLNNKYELDGRDPNGYTGIAWCIGGVHDRPWFDRKIFGMVRYMNFNGCKSKFDVERYIKKQNHLPKLI
jgi:deoxyribodipyrimidine photo-lyase